MQERLKNIYSKTPSKIFLVANMAILVSCFLLVLLSFVISYNDIVYADVILHPKEPYTIAKTQTQGFIDQMYVHHGDTISEGKILATIENNGSIDDILELKKTMGNIRMDKKDNLNLIIEEKYLSYRYGEVQPYFYDFLHSVQDYLGYSTRQPLASNILSIKEQVKNQEALLKNQTQKLQNFKNIISIWYKNLKKNEGLYAKGVISENDLTSIQSEYFTKLNELSELSSNVERTRVSLVELKTNKYNLSNDSINRDQLFVESLNSNYNSLNNAIETWEKKYVLKSSIDGIVSLNDNIEESQYVEVGKNIFTVYPISVLGFNAVAKIKASNSGKVKKGQIAYIRLEHLPSSQFGKYKAEVTGIAKTPEALENTYTVFLKLDELTSDYGHELDLNGTMIGKCEIVTEKHSLAQRMLYGLRELFQRKPG